MIKTDRPLVFVQGMYDKESKFADGRDINGNYFYQDSTAEYVVRKGKLCVRCGDIKEKTIVWRDAIHHKTYCLTCVDTTTCLRNPRG